MKHLIIFLLIAITFSTQAQSPFKKLQKPAKKYGAVYGATANNEISAFRFSVPTAETAFYPNGEIKVVTGLGFGLHRLHFVDSTAKWYDDFSVKAAIYAHGNVTPSIKDNNIFGIGIGVGLLNELINAGIIYNVPTTAGTKGKIGFHIGFGVSLNN